MTIALLATGDEIVHGDTLNTNSRDIAHILSSEGLPLGLHMACSDKKADIVNCIQFLSQQHDILIIIGGLGPTSDDLTRFALAEFTGDTLIQHAEALAHVEQRLKMANVTINEGNLQQCLFPPQARILPNPYGSAVGCYYSWQQKTFILLPGPPRECLPMLQQHALPALAKTQRSQKEILKWRIFGVAESEIGQILEDALAAVDCQTGYRLEVPYIEFKVRCRPHEISKVKEIVDPILAPHIIASVDKKASDKLRDLIISQDEPITILDEVTGGLLESLLNKPATHHLVSFNNLKQTRLSFHLSGLEEYWSGKNATGLSQVKIHYHNQQRKGEETHTVPFRSSLVLYYAAEWLSFRLFQLINQLHQGIA